MPSSSRVCAVKSTLLPMIRIDSPGIDVRRLAGRLEAHLALDETHFMGGEVRGHVVEEAFDLDPHADIEIVDACRRDIRSGRW